MALSFNETDTQSAGGLLAACSPNTIGAGASAVDSKIADGTLGVTAVSETMSASETNKVYLAFDITPPAGATWAAGNYVLRWNLTTADASINWVRTDICRINSGGVNQATIGTDTTSRGLGTAQIFTVTISGSAQTPAAGDRIYIVLSFTNTATMPKAFGWTPNSTIDTPLVAASGVPVQLNMAPYVAASW